MKKGLAFVVFAVSMLLTLTQACAQHEQPLGAGFNEERTLGPGDNNIYTIALRDGMGLLGEIGRRDVDLVVDIYGPNGAQLRHIELRQASATAEAIELNAWDPGDYKLMIHMLNTSKAPGKYVMRINQVLSAEQNGERLAKEHYPPGSRNFGWHI